jgi:formylglycine-generating enzyme required for sulfatase activity
VSRHEALATNPNQLPARLAMGVPDGLVDRLGPDVLRRHTDLLRLAPSDLVLTLESDQVAADRRYAAGAALSWLGDPRLDLDSPSTIALPGGRVVLGLDPERVDAVIARWRRVGVRPEWIRKECPTYTVELAPFAIGRFPVTNFEYYAFLRDTGSAALPSSWSFGAYPAAFANHPVWTVPPEAADAFAAWLSARVGRRFRLPSEAEWEYAAAGAEGREYPWGDDFEPHRANTVEAGPLSTTPVGMYPEGRTPTGIDDLAGNVEEYTADIYRPYPGGARIADDLLMTHGNYRVARGGSFARWGDLARCRRRHGWYPSPLYVIGFRLAETLA